MASSIQRRDASNNLTTAAAAAAQWSSTRRRVTDLYVTRGCLRAASAQARMTSTPLLQRRRCAEHCSCIDAARRGSARATRSVQPLICACVFFLFPPFASLPSRLVAGRPAGCSCIALHIQPCKKTVAIFSFSANQPLCHCGFLKVIS